MYKRILIATDGSPLSRKAIATGIEIAKSMGATVVGFNARAPRPPLYTGEAATMVPPEILDRFEQDSIASAEQYVAEVGSAAREAGVPFEGVQEANDSPADAILAMAKKKGCDLIVMASHGRKGLARVVLGSETVKVLTHSPIAVLVTR